METCGGPIHFFGEAKHILANIFFYVGIYIFKEDTTIKRQRWHTCSRVGNQMAGVSFKHQRGETLAMIKWQAFG